jgi:hypothetical protein
VTTLLLIFSGKPDALLKAASLTPQECAIINVDEKIVAAPRALLGLMNAKPYQQIVIGCDRLESHRFARIQKTFLLLSKPKRGFLIDEHGRRDTFSITRYALIDFPKLIAELVISGVVTIASYMRFYVDKTFLKPNR